MNIAIIDDSMTILLTTEAKLKQAGVLQSWDKMYKFHNATSFLEELKKIGPNEFGIIIVDQDLGKDEPKGYELINTLQSAGYKNKAVLFTADDSVKMHMKMAFAHHVDYVVKESSESFKTLSKLIQEARDANI